MGQSCEIGYTIKEEIEIYRWIDPNARRWFEQRRGMIGYNTLVNSWILNTIKQSLRSFVNYSERADESQTNLQWALALTNLYQDSSMACIFWDYILYINVASYD